MPNATKLRTPKGGHPSGHSEWRIEGEPNRFRFCTALPKSGVVDAETSRVWGRGRRLLVAAFGACVGLFEELPGRPA